MGRKIRVRWRNVYDIKGNIPKWTRKRNKKRKRKQIKSNGGRKKTKTYREMRSCEHPCNLQSKTCQYKKSTARGQI